MKNLHPILQQALMPFVIGLDQGTNLPVVGFNDKDRAANPCIVQREGMRFVHDPEVSGRTDKFFGVIK